jgi:hypothetical protein
VAQCSIGNSEEDSLGAIWNGAIVLMKLFRYRRPSLNTLLGVTKAKKRVKKELGITAAMKPFRFWTNAKRRFKRKVGYESDAGRLIRNGLPRPGGCLVVVIAVAVAAMAVVAMAR